MGEPDNTDRKTPTRNAADAAAGERKALAPFIPAGRNIQYRCLAHDDRAATSAAS